MLCLNNNFWYGREAPGHKDSKAACLIDGFLEQGNFNTGFLTETGIGKRGLFGKVQKGKDRFSTDGYSDSEYSNDGNSRHRHSDSSQHYHSHDILARDGPLTKGHEQHDKGRRSLNDGGKKDNHAALYPKGGRRKHSYGMDDNMHDSYDRTLTGYSRDGMSLNDILQEFVDADGHLKGEQATRKAWLQLD